MVARGGRVEVRIEGVPYFAEKLIIGAASLEVVSLEGVTGLGVAHERSK